MENGSIVLMLLEIIALLAFEMRNPFFPFCCGGERFNH